MPVRGCNECGEYICITASAGGGVTALGVLAPIPYMIWNTLAQCICSIPVCLIACCGGNGCLCGVAGGVAGCSDLLLPVWCCAAPHCACGSCASLGTMWMQIITFAGFGAAWYVGLADVLIIIGMVACMMALVWWGMMCFLERDKTKATSAPTEEQKSMITANSTEDNPPPTGAMKF